MPLDVAGAPPIDASARPQVIPLDTGAASIDANTDAGRAQLDGRVDASMCGPLGLSHELVQHACSHAEHGPYRSVSGAATPLGAPDVSRPHTLFRIDLPASSSASVFVRFVPAQAGEYAFLSRHGTLIDALSVETGTAYDASSEEGTSCALLSGVALLDLRQAGAYTLQLARDGAEAIELAIESLATHTSAFCGPSACGDAGSCPEAPSCRSSGSCSSDADCCAFCHDGDHCH